MDVDLGKRAREQAVRRASKSLSSLLEEDGIAARMVAADTALPDRHGYLTIAREAADGGFAALRIAKRRRLLEIAARDLAGEIDLGEVGRALADLADGCVEACLEALGAAADIAVIGMGKLGGHELNYSSDIDLLFVANGDDRAATRAATSLLRELGAVSAEGQAYRIDTNLRPEGRSGALVRSLEGYGEYYRRWAEPWEFQALIKARPSAGAVEPGRRFLEMARDFVWPRDVSPERVAEVRKMKEKVESHAIQAARRDKTGEALDVKLGPGGIRDIEFAVQLLQLVHGTTDPSVRSPNTLEALTSLTSGGYVAEEDGAGLSVAYRWLRTVEHRLQLWQERQVHRLPKEDDARKRVAYVMGFRDRPSESALDRFDFTHGALLADVRARFEKLFYRPMIEALAEGVGPRLSPDALGDRLRVLGFRDVERAARTLAGLVTGTSRRAKLFKVLTPAMLRFLASSPAPDEGLLGFLRLGEALAGRLDVLGALRDNPPGLAFLARALGSGRLLGEVLLHVPDEVATIADPTRSGELKERARLVREATASLGWREPDGRLDGLRRFKRREMLHVALADLNDDIHGDDVGRGLSDLADACLEAALAESPAASLAVIGMGKLGGRELTYASDIDVMFVHDSDPAVAEKTAEELIRAIGEVTPEGQAFRIDAALRPEGHSGALARSLDAYREYYRRWASPWERLALLKARVAAGDATVGRALVTDARDIAFGAPPSHSELMEIRHLKARMEKERIPRSADPRRHLKLGPGGTSDVEFAVQILQMVHGESIPELRVAGTLDAITASARAGLISERDEHWLSEAYRWLTRLRNRMYLFFARPVDILPSKTAELEALGIAMGLSAQPRQELEETYLRITRRARKVAEPLIYGRESR